MESSREFDKTVGDLIALKYVGDWVVSDADGLRVKEEYKQEDPTKIFRWTPACEMEGWPEAPNALTHPALPFPFNAKQLAAFMIYGVGTFVADVYGDIADGPDEKTLEGLGIDAGHAREALRSAYASVRAATARVGALDDELLRRASTLQDEYSEARRSALEREKVMEPNAAGLPEAEYLTEYRRRLKLAVDPLADLEAEMRRASAEAEAAWSKWRKAMVRELLAVEQVPVVDLPSEEQSPPVEPAKRRNRKLSWLVVSMPYMKKLHSEGRYRSGAMFYKALLTHADMSDSPFTKVRGELYCAKAGTTVSEGSVNNAWAEIRAE